MVDLHFLIPQFYPLHILHLLWWMNYFEDGACNEREAFSKNESLLNFTTELMTLEILYTLYLTYLEKEVT